MKRAITLLSLLAITACANQGPIYKQPPNGSVVLYRYLYWSPAASAWHIDVNGTHACELSSGSYYAIPHHKDDITLSSALFGQPGTSRITVHPSKQTQYVRIELNMGRSLLGAVGGLAAQAVAEGVDSDNGSFIFKQVSEAEARKDLAELHQDCM